VFFGLFFAHSVALPENADCIERTRIALHIHTYTMVTTRGSTRSSTAASKEAATVPKPKKEPRAKKRASPATGAEPDEKRAKTADGKAKAKPKAKPAKEKENGQTALEDHGVTTTNGDDKKPDGATNGDDKKPDGATNGDDKQPDAATNGTEKKEDDGPADGATALETDPAREKKTEESAILEKGLVYFFLRPKVDVAEPESLDEVKRAYMVLRPLPAGAKLADGKLADGGNNRLIAIPKKRLPGPRGHERFLTFVEATWAE